MSLLDKASLIVTPNAYKTSKLYSVVPNTTLGDMTVVRGTTATRVNSAGLIESVGVNIPRINYTNGSCPSILVEPQRTNLALYSEQFENAAWNKTNATVTANATTAPNGTMTADKLIETTSVATPHRTFQSFSATVGFIYTITIYAKAAERRYFSIRPEGAANYAIFDLQDGVITNVIAGVTATIQSVGNGWYRCSATKVASVINWNTMIYLQNNGSDSGSNYTGDGTSGIFIWGAQLEFGSYPTSYIPTVASIQSRNADEISKTGISSLIGQTEGTVYVKMKKLNIIAPEGIFQLDNGTSNTRISIGFSPNSPTTTRLNLYSSLGGTFYAYSDSFTTALQNTTKVAVGYAENNLALYANGVQIYTDSSFPVFTSDNLNKLFVNANLAVDEIILFKTRLTNAEIAQLTTL